MITKEQLEELKKTLMRPRPSELWVVAFKEFNDNRDVSIMKYPLGLHCRSCYFKVFKYHEKKLSE